MCSAVEDTFAFRLGASIANEEGKKEWHGLTPKSEEVVDWLMDVDEPSNYDGEETPTDAILRHYGWKGGYHPKAEVMRMGFGDKWYVFSVALGDT